MPPAQNPQDLIKVMLADANLMACQSLANVLSSHARLHVAGWELDSATALSAVDRLRPDVALIGSDLQDGPGQGLTLASLLRTQHPDVRTVILLDRVDRKSTIDAFRAGARGILARSQDLAVLPKCVRRVSEGQIWANSKELAYLVDTLSSASPDRVLSDRCRTLLTEREQQVVRLVADGLCNREIAAQLHLSPHTVKNYLFQVFDKIGVSSRVELVFCALTDPISAAKPGPQTEKKNGMSLKVRRRPDTMTNA